MRSNVASSMRPAVSTPTISAPSALESCLTCRRSRIRVLYPPEANAQVGTFGRPGLVVSRRFQRSPHGPRAPHVPRNLAALPCRPRADDSRAPSIPASGAPRRLLASLPRGDDRLTFISMQKAPRCRPVIRKPFGRLLHRRAMRPNVLRRCFSMLQSASVISCRLRIAVAGTTFALLVAGCVSTPSTSPSTPAAVTPRAPATDAAPLPAPTPSSKYYSDDGPPSSVPADLDRIPDAVPKLEPL